MADLPVYNPQKAHYIAVTGILVRNNKFLIAQRAYTEKEFPNLWTVPGGKLEVTDYTGREKDTSAHWYNVLEDALRREVMEEVRLQIRDIRYLTSMVYIRPDAVPCLIVSMYASPKKGEVKLCPALTDYAWVTLEKARRYPLIEGIYEELEMLDRVLKGKKTGVWKKG